MEGVANRRTRTLVAVILVLVVSGTARAQGSADCNPLERQLDRDKLALTRQQQSIQQGLRDLEEWTKANEEAQRDALLRGARLVADIAVTKLERA